MVYLEGSSDSGSSTARQDGVYEPWKFDILCGKDKTFNHHTGNVLFREQVKLQAPIYATSSKLGRMLITKDIVSHLRKLYGSRFLLHVQNREDGTKIWKEIDDSQARDKTSHALRFALKQNNCLEHSFSLSSRPSSHHRDVRGRGVEQGGEQHRRVVSYDDSDSIESNTDSRDMILDSVSPVAALMQLASVAVQMKM